MTARHFLDLPGAATVDTVALTLTRRAIVDITRHRGLGVVHGAAGLGKTFAVEHALEHLDVVKAPLPLQSPSAHTPGTLVRS